jgi:hypothetical protein
MYGSRTFDILFGVVLASVTGIYSLIIDVVLIVSFNQDSTSRPLFATLLGLSVPGGLGCIALVVSVLSGVQLSRAGRAICLVLLCCGVGVALLLTGLLMFLAAGSLNNGGLWLLLPSFLFVMISLAAIKQIGLLRMSKPGRPL